MFALLCCSIKKKRQIRCGERGDVVLVLVVRVSGVSCQGVVVRSC